MNSRPKLDHLTLALPNLPGYNEALWETLLRLAHTEPQQEWTLIGGQMVLLHALEHDVEPTRLSTDIDVVINARVVTGGIQRFVKTIESLGFSLAGVSPEGVAHRYRRGMASIDVLAPEGLGPRTDLTTTSPSRTLQVPGGTQALERTELLPVQFAGQEGLIPRPSLLGAIVCKAAAVSVDDAPDAQRRDMALLLSLVDDPDELATNLTRKDRQRLRRVAELASADHGVWRDLSQDAADRARLAYQTLSKPPPPRAPAGPDAYGSDQLSFNNEATV